MAIVTYCIVDMSHVQGCFELLPHELHELPLLSRSEVKARVYLLTSLFNMR